MLEAALETYHACTHTGVKDLLYNALMLHCLTLVHKNIDWYMMNGIVSVEAGKELELAQLAAVKHTSGA